MTEPQTPHDLVLMDLADARKRDPDARICAEPQAVQMPNGPANGEMAVICYLYPATQGRPSFEAAEVWIEAINSDASLDFAIQLLMPTANADTFEREAAPVIRSVTWKLYTAPVSLPSDSTIYPPPQQQLCFTDPMTHVMTCIP